MNILVLVAIVLIVELIKKTIWKARCDYETVEKKRNAFVTLTYDDNHLYYKENSVFPSLNRKDVHLFLDNLKHYCKCFDYKIFLVGEYGDIFNRPHIHFLAFGLDFKDFEHVFTKKWRNGLVKSLPLLPGAVSYCVDYMTKALNGDMAVKQYDDLNIERPFFTASKGLGLSFFLDHKDEINRTGTVKIGQRTCCVPLYYKNMLSYYDDEDVDNRNMQRFLNFKLNATEVMKRGYKSYYDYVVEQTKIKEKREFKKYLGQGEFHYCQSLHSDTLVAHRLASLAMEV